MQLASALEELDLSENPLRDLTAETFRDLTKLKRLLLNRCSIESVDQDAFATLLDLKKLSLDANYLESFPPCMSSEAFQPQNLSRVPRRSFFPRLQELDLNLNRLTDIREIALPSQLEVLGLAYNKIRATPLRVLRLSTNLLTDSSVDLPLNTPGTITIDLFNNRLESMPILPSQINGQWKIDVCFNEIRSLEMQAFRTPGNQSSLEIDLRGNLLERIDTSAVETVTTTNATDITPGSVMYVISPLEFGCHLLEFYQNFKSNKTAALGKFSKGPQCTAYRLVMVW